MTAPFLTETRERFLKAVLTKLPIEEIREAYLFQPIKQGGIESGVAVLAARVPGETPEAPNDGASDAPSTSGERYTVYMAHYRLTLKGPDRGKWEWNVVAEAEAPLLSIESVVRGVQRRSGDLEAPDHMSADELRASLRLQPQPSGEAAGETASDAA